MQKLTMDQDDFIQYSRAIAAQVSMLQGRQSVNTLVLEFLLGHNPSSLKALRQIGPDHLEELLVAQSISRESMPHAREQLALLRDTVDLTGSSKDQEQLL